MKQQFLTVFNSTATTVRTKRKQENKIIDFINATYQGQLSHFKEPEGTGTLIDDQFNFIFCDAWKRNKMYGEVFIKLASQITIWGKWANNSPSRLCSLQISHYLIHIANYQKHSNTPTHCLITNQHLKRQYLAQISKNNENERAKRQYNVMILKIQNLKSDPLLSLAKVVEEDLSDIKLNPSQYLDYLIQQLKILRRNDQENGFLLSAYDQLENDQDLRHLKLGLLLDHKKKNIKSVGIFANNSATQNSVYSLNGLGMTKTHFSDTLMGIFKNDMLVKDFSSKANYQPTRNINGSVVKQNLSHEHMKSLFYEHSYQYFQQINKIVKMGIEIHKYVEMFERLSHFENESSFEEQKNYKKYENSKEMGQNLQESSETIINQFQDLKVNLKSTKYHEENLNQQNYLGMKKPGFILHRSPHKHSPKPRINRQVDFKSPVRHEQRCKNWRR